MENSAKYELPFDLAHFQAEEMEERLENKWGGDECEPFIEVTNEPATGPRCDVGVRIPI